MSYVAVQIHSCVKETRQYWAKLAEAGGGGGGGKDKKNKDDVFPLLWYKNVDRKGEYLDIIAFQEPGCYRFSLCILVPPDTHRPAIKEQDTLCLLEGLNLPQRSR